MDTLLVRYDADSRQGGLIINGRPLLELVREIEEPLVRAEVAAREGEGESDVGLTAGHYMYPAAAGVRAGTFWGRIEECFVIGPDDPGSGKLVVLDCDCGCSGCWPLVVRVEVEPTIVRWSDFAQFHRPEWRYPLGPFEFDRAEYERQLGRCG